jgi:hypothetical protein
MTQQNTTPAHDQAVESLGRTVKLNDEMTYCRTKNDFCENKRAHLVVLCQTLAGESLPLCDKPMVFSTCFCLFRS